METIEVVRKRFGVTILLIEHDMKLVSGICEYLYVLNFGRLLAEGTPKEVLSNPELYSKTLSTPEEGETKPADEKADSSTKGGDIAYVFDQTVG